MKTSTSGSSSSIVKRCCWFSFYQLNYFVSGAGGDEAAAAMIQRFRARTAAQARRLNAARGIDAASSSALDDPNAVCDCVNLGGMGAYSGSGTENLDSISDYGYARVRACVRARVCVRVCDRQRDAVW